MNYEALVNAILYSKQDPKVLASFLMDIVKRLEELEEGAETQ